MLSLLLTWVLGAAPDVELLYFKAGWCGACRQMEPVVGNLRREGYPIREIDVDLHPATARRFGVTALPTFVLVEDGKARFRIVGATSENRLRRMIAQGRSPTPTSKAPSRPRSSSEDAWPRGRREPRPESELLLLRAASVKVSVRHFREHWYGSGTCVSSNGNRAVVLTAAHVVRYASQGRVTVTFPNGLHLAARVRYANPERDIAVLVVETKQFLPTVPVGQRTPRPGEPVKSIGYPGGGRQRTLAGRVISIGRWSGYTEASMSAAQGHSGGGLFHDGRLVGVLWGSGGTSLYASLDDIRLALDAAGLSSVWRGTVETSEVPPVGLRRVRPRPSNFLIPAKAACETSPVVLGSPVE